MGRKSPHQSMTIHAAEGEPETGGSVHSKRSKVQSHRSCRQDLGGQGCVASGDGLSVGQAGIDDILQRCSSSMHVHFDTCEGWELVGSSEIPTTEDSQDRNTLVKILDEAGWLPPAGESHTLLELRYYASLLRASLTRQMKTVERKKIALNQEASQHEPSPCLPKRRKGETMVSVKITRAAGSVVGVGLSSLSVDLVGTICTWMKARSILRLACCAKTMDSAIMHSNVWRQLYFMHAPVTPSLDFSGRCLDPGLWRGMYRAMFRDHLLTRKSKACEGLLLRVEWACPVAGCGCRVQGQHQLESHLMLHFDEEAHTTGCPKCMSPVPCTVTLTSQVEVWEACCSSEWLQEELTLLRSDKKWHKSLPKARHLPQSSGKPIGIRKKGRGWTGVVFAGGAKVLLGQFQTQEHAALVYDAAKRLLVPRCSLTKLNYPLCTPPIEVTAAIEKLLRIKIALRKFRSQTKIAGGPR